MLVERLQTPALIVEESVMKENMATMKTLLEGTNLALRPHFKSHKCAAIAKLQMAYGAKGMTCAKLSEAQELADIGVEDILIANQVVEPRKVRQLAEMALDCRLTVCVDNEENIRALSEAAQAVGAEVHCLIEFEIGMNRCGVSDPQRVLQLARYIKSLPGVEFDGIQAYAGHLAHVIPQQDRRSETFTNHEKLRALLKLLENNGIPVSIVSGGSTGTCQIKADEDLYGELQAGSYLFMDASYSTLEKIPFRNSLFLLTTVVSVSEDLVVVDAGVKTCGVDQGMPLPVGFTAEEICASEEHFQIHKPSRSFRVGDKILLIPGHSCSTVNMHDRIYVVSDGKVLDRHLITGRGYGK